jgi:hypothetical protein
MLQAQGQAEAFALTQVEALARVSNHNSEQGSSQAAQLSINPPKSFL